MAFQSKLGYHWAVDTNYKLLTTRELPECSALGYGLDLDMTLMFLVHDV